MIILKYTPAVKELLDSETTPEPFMHVAVLKGGEHRKLSETKGWYSVFIWDNRKVLESDSYDAKNYSKLSKARKAVDNKQPLQGSGADVVNELMKEKSPAKADMSGNKRHDTTTLVDKKTGKRTTVKSSFTKNKRRDPKEGRIVE